MPSASFAVAALQKNKGGFWGMGYLAALGAYWVIALAASLLLFLQSGAYPRPCRAWRQGYFQRCFPAVLGVDRNNVFFLNGKAGIHAIKPCLLYTSWKGDTLPAWAKRLSYMKSKGAGNKAHLQPVTHFLVHIGIGIAPVSYTHLDVYKRQAPDFPRPVLLSARPV